MKKKTLINTVLSIGLICLIGFSFLYLNNINLINQVTDFMGPQQKKMSTPGFKFAMYGDAKSGVLLQYPVTAVIREKGIYVVDQDAGNIKVFGLGGRLAGVFGRLRSPYGIALYGGNFYVSDMGTGQIVIFSKTGKQLGTLKIKGQKGMVPGGLLVDGKYLYIADVYQSRILVCDLPQRRIIRTMGSFGTGRGQLKYPHGMAVDKAGNLYVADSGNNRIVVFNKNGRYLKTIGGKDDRVGGITTVRGVAIDAKGIIYATAPLTGTIYAYNGDGEALYSLGGPGKENGQLGLPNDILIDAAGRLYVVETKNKRISVFEK
ncbi:NHL repeat containing protein [Thermincola ferriacetica]|uniref:NHL repeat containing protein n=1 Tax=Thermincola ferriacetica TaxID=281456 RepID=A0A0L6VYZ7_9FIRM|nr:SMP-30/gluconolactonase/LRE family protein [Thermincola ferriacetica]KNZ68552.1 NHL repeat containing protein [Thermincola ferriacetica]